MQEKTDQLAARFRQEYEKLNKEQRKAVDTIEGPVMVIAGPGTGKTQILASRIGKILLETDTRPENILCLTYTDAGVVAMRRRLLDFIGSAAYKVHIHTFHSFCNTVIQENIQYFNKKDLEALTDLERVDYLQQLIDSFDRNNPLKRYKGEIYYDADNLARLFSAIKREGWKEEWLLRQIDDYTKNVLPETDGYYNKREKKKGETVLTQKGVEQVERMEKLKAAVKAFKDYQEILTNHQRYDFDDMINWVIAMFEQHPDILLSYQERFQYILVDEYQDTSGTQNRLVELLISYWQDESPNIFVVGDDDQSIYRFQGANLQNMMNLANKYEKDLVKVVLTNNYRSVQSILDGARALIENNEQRLVKQYKDLNKDLLSANPGLNLLTLQPVIRVYENEFAENADIAVSIKKLVDAGTQPGHIAVIYREHKLGDELLKFLQLLDIPFYVKRAVNLLEDVFINQLLNLMRYTAAELDMPFSGEPLLFEIMHYQFFGIDPFRIALVTHEIGSGRSKSREENSLRGWIAKLVTQNAGKLFPPDEQSAAIIRLGKLLEGLQQELYNKSLQHWFEWMVNESGILAYIMQQPDKSWQMSKLSCLFDYIKENTHRNPSLTLAALVAQLDLLASHGLALPLVQTTGTDTGVNLLTAHGSKGLEFEHVFLMGARRDTWENKRKAQGGFVLPHTIFEQEKPAETLEELRRLFFVAVTRAEKHLYISYPAMKNDGKILEPSQFVEEFRRPIALETERPRLTDEEKLMFSALRFGIVRKPVLEQVEKDFVSRLVQNFVMNVTALNNYLECPLKFYYTTLLRVPSAKSESMEYGSAVHDALNDFMTQMMKNKRTYPPKSYLLQRFEFYLRKRREVFTQLSLARFSEYGETTLGKYYDSRFKEGGEGTFVMTEYAASATVMKGIPLKGFIDKIQFMNNDIIVTDYKTSTKAKAAKNFSFSRPGKDEKKPAGGNYWRQAAFYKLLIDHIPVKNWNVLFTEFDFLDPNEKEDFDLVRVDIGQEDVEAVSLQIEETWQKIQAHDFYTGCGNEKCEWCNFTRNNKLYARLEEAAEAVEE